MILIIFIVIISSCSQYFFWYPKYGENTVLKSVSLNHKNVALKISRFAFVNHSYGPYITLKLKNLSNDTLTINQNSFKIITGLDTIYYDNRTDQFPDEIKPGDSRSYSIIYSILLDNPNKNFKRNLKWIHHPRKTDIEFRIESLELGNQFISFPPILYKSPYVNGYKKYKFL